MLETLCASRLYDFSGIKKSGTHLLYTYLAYMGARLDQNLTWVNKNDVIRKNPIRAYY